MAFYKVLFEGREYISGDMYMRVFNIGEAGLFKRQNSKIILDTTVFGPLSPEESKECAKHPFVLQDFDAATAQFEKADGTEQELSLNIEPGHIIKYRNRLYVKFTNLYLDKKYRLLSRMAHVKVCGHGIYVCLGSKVKGFENPVVVTAK